MKGENKIMEKTFEYVYENDGEFMCPLVSRLRGEIMSCVGIICPMFKVTDLDVEDFTYYKGECITTYLANRSKKVGAENEAKEN